ncbi:hypothetical protein JSMCR1_p662 (plasmid) [Escherichia coli]|nr:hypothetical protein JSMCR1_p662 [Escherichia coli]
MVQSMQDRQSTRNCMQFSVDCPKTMFLPVPAAGSMVKE